MLVFDTARPFDEAAVEALLDRAFGAGRFAKTAQRLRDGRCPADGLAFVARDGAGLAGTLTFWEVDAGDRPALLLGPLAVAPEARSQGVGGMLVRRGLAEAAWRGHGAVVLVGDASYYSRFGFNRAAVAGLRLPGPVDLDRFLGLELVPGALAGAEGLVAPAGRPAAALPLAA